jgi:hypothetical protein
MCTYFSTVILIITCKYNLRSANDIGFTSITLPKWHPDNLQECSYIDRYASKEDENKFPKEETKLIKNISTTSKPSLAGLHTCQEYYDTFSVKSTLRNHSSRVVCVSLVQWVLIRQRPSSPLIWLLIRLTAMPSLYPNNKMMNLIKV